MAAESRATQSPGTRAMKASKQFASSVSASAPLKRHVQVPNMLKSVKGTIAKSPSTSSSDSSSGNLRGLNGGKAISNRKISLGTKDAPRDAIPSPGSENSDETTGKEFEASNESLLDCIEPDETERIIDMEEPSLLIPDLQLKDLDVVHSNLAVNWFHVDDPDFLKTKAHKNPHLTSSEKQKSLSILESTNNGYIDEFEGETGLVCIINTPLQDNISEDLKTVVEEITILKTPDVTTECSEENNNFQNYEGGITLPEKSEGKNDFKLAFDSLMRQGGHGIDAFGGSRLVIKILLPASLFVICIILFCVDNLVEDELVRVSINHSAIDKESVENMSCCGCIQKPDSCLRDNELSLTRHSDLDTEVLHKVPLLTQALWNLDKQVI